ADGMELGLNARTGLITRGLNEMLRLNAAIGGRAETLMGLAGLGDLVLTCTGDLSRNRRLGLALGRGQTLEDAVREIGQVVESVQTANEVMRLADRHGLELPIAQNVRDVLHGDITPAEGLQRLLARDQKAEYPPGMFCTASGPPWPPLPVSACRGPHEKARLFPAGLCDLSGAERRLPGQARTHEPFGVAVGKLAAATHAPVRVELPLRAEAAVE